MKQLIAGCALALAASTAIAAPVPDQTAPQTDARQSAQHRDEQAQWLDSVASVDLTAVDGSRLRFTLDDSGMTRHMASSDGGEQATAFVFLNHDLGTVRDADGQISGFFRRTAGGLEITYADGRLETIALLDDGGISMTLRTPGGPVVCEGWYPKGHAFSDSEKRIALAHYAKQLGIALPAGSEAPPSSAGCALSHSSAVADTPANPSSPAAAKPLASHHSRKTAALTLQVEPASQQTVLPALTPVAVRISEVHPVPAPADTPDPVKGASNCLAVDSDGGHWGFRNSCSYDVEYAFCLKDAGVALASCDKGAVSGLVAAGGFTPLIKASVLGGNDAEHRFRWIACGLSDGALEARLDQTSPPAGRCVRPS